jgi:hypothetical protein
MQHSNDRMGIIMQETEENWWDVLYNDPPFNVHTVTTLEYASHMAGKAAQLYLEQFKQKYESSLANSVVTTVAGDPGTGKSYFFSHLMYRMSMSGDMPGIPIIIRLLGKKYQTKDFFSKIRDAKAYKKACERAGIEVCDVPDEILGPTIGREITAIRETEPNTSICLLLDNVDEYVRSNGHKYETEEYRGREEAREQAMLALLRLVNAVTDAVGTGLCVVLSLTVDMVKILNLGSFDSGNMFTPLLGTDASLRRRFQPIYASRDSHKLHFFGPLTLEETYEMIANYMSSFFNSHSEIARRTIPECIIQDYNIYPFTVETISLIHEASGYPGEIVLGCLSAVQRFREFQNEIQRNMPEYKELGSTITPPFAALGILQMSDYFRNVTPEFISRLKEQISSDPAILYLEVFPQLVERTKLGNVDWQDNFGEAFLDFLGRIGLEDYQPLQSKQRFVSTRGKITFPNFPLIDCTFTYKDQKFGVQSLSENFSGLDMSKFKTAATTIKAAGADHFVEDDFLDNVIFICLAKDTERSSIADRILDAIDSHLIDIQGKDYRPRVGLVFVDEDTVWNWKTLKQTDLLTNEQKNMFALLMEQAAYMTWVVKGVNVQKEYQEGTGRSLLDVLLKGTDILPPVRLAGHGVPP